MQLTYIFIYAILAGLNVVYTGLLHWHRGILASACITGILTVPAYPFKVGFVALLSAAGAACLACC
jgi:hypothetical protein